MLLVNAGVLSYLWITHRQAATSMSKTDLVAIPKSSTASVHPQQRPKQTGTSVGETPISDTVVRSTKPDQSRRVRRSMKPRPDRELGWQKDPTDTTLAEIPETSTHAFKADSNATSRSSLSPSAVHVTPDAESVVSAPSDQAPHKPDTATALPPEPASPKRTVSQLDRYGAIPFLSTMPAVFQRRIPK